MDQHRKKMAATSSSKSRKDREKEARKEEEEKAERLKKVSHQQQIKNNEGMGQYGRMCFQWNNEGMGQYGCMHFQWNTTRCICQLNNCQETTTLNTEFKYTESQTNSDLV